MKAKSVGNIDQPIWIKGTAATPIALRLVAIRKPEAAIAETRSKLEAEARAKGRELQPETLVAAGWVILVTSLDAIEFPTAAIGEPAGEAGPGADGCAAMELPATNRTGIQNRRQIPLRTVSV